MTLGSNSLQLVPVTINGCYQWRNKLVSAIIDNVKLPRRRRELKKVPQIEKPIIMGSLKLFHEKMILKNYITASLFCKKECTSKKWVLDGSFLQNFRRE